MDVKQNLHQSLAQGLLVENWEILLPWGASLNEITRLTPPSHTVHWPVWDEL